MARIVSGDETAFRYFAERHVARMLQLAQSILGSSAEADEVAQEALLRVWRHAARWDSSRSQLGTWVHTIVARLCVDRLRQRRHQPIEAAEEIADPAVGAFESLSARREAQALRLRHCRTASVSRSRSFIWRNCRVLTRPRRSVLVCGPFGLCSNGRATRCVTECSARATLMEGCEG